MANTRLYWLHCMSPTHVGIGRGVGYIDLPIDRDAVTGWPIIRASAFKGVLADHYQATDANRRTKPLLRAAFGVAGADNISNSGALMPTDARLVCLPVRSFRGTFGWATSPLCLQILHRHLTLAGLKAPNAPNKTLNEDTCHITSESSLSEDTRATVAGSAAKIEKRVFLEDLDFKAHICETATTWAKLIGEQVFADDPAWQQEFLKRFVVLPDMAFDYLCESGTEVHTRVRIDDELKTVAQGALWTEESLPAESILMGVVQCDRVFGTKKSEGDEVSPSRILDEFATKPLTLQIGGKATVGRGQVRCTFREVAQ